MVRHMSKNRYHYYAGRAGSWTVEISGPVGGPLRMEAFFGDNTTAALCRPYKGTVTAAAATAEATAKQLDTEGWEA